MIEAHSFFGAEADSRHHPGTSVLQLCRAVRMKGFSGQMGARRSRRYLHQMANYVAVLGLLPAFSLCAEQTTRWWRRRLRGGSFLNGERRYCRQNVREHPPLPAWVSALPSARSSCPTRFAPLSTNSGERAWRMSKAPVPELE